MPQSVVIEIPFYDNVGAVTDVQTIAAVLYELKRGKIEHIAVEAEIGICAQAVDGKVAREGNILFQIVIANRQCAAGDRQGLICHTLVSRMVAHRAAADAVRMNGRRHFYIFLIPIRNIICVRRIVARAQCLAGRSRTVYQIWTISAQRCIADYNRRGGFACCKRYDPHVGDDTNQQTACKHESQYPVLSCPKKRF